MKTEKKSPVKALGKAGFVPGEAANLSRLESRRQSAHSALIVLPTKFEFNTQAAADNVYMQKMSADKAQAAASEEASGLRDALLRTGVNLTVITAAENTPDAIFPNNWFSTHSAEETNSASSQLFLYPMKPENRRLERRPDIIGTLVQTMKNVTVTDLSAAELSGSYLEGTGAIVLDRRRRIAFVSLSQRADEKLAREWCTRTGYQLVLFHATDAEGTPIYHTNVILSVGTNYAVFCSDAVQDPTERDAVLAALKPLSVIEVTQEQIGQFCGNCLELSVLADKYHPAANNEGTSNGSSHQAADGQQSRKRKHTNASSQRGPLVNTEDGAFYLVLFMSSAAYNGFTTDQLSTLKSAVNEIVHVPIPTIESVGGGSVRCMIAELWGV